ncbi:hypothetical protein CLV28_2099 [Sediminihabitans luteus]|uniref:Uncharacterized protein n=1 Tax=Sediminihabitans luteus TaxID=1138585 RepID=A0A2M9CEG1_9CELL|nr:hypothetical protein [Sediminihabitans luteus]PJJ70268.1 hypothetical protein CLV28_2099 [Sediminihabitans luteus]GII97739.1 hypothetical protein Slu03_01170 [Sediminihabitans luteus]
MTHEAADDAGQDHAAPDDASRTSGVRPRRLLLHGLSLSVTGNAQAFGYSITVTATYGAVAANHDSPTPGEVMGFALCAVLAFSVLNLVVAALIRRDPTEGVPEPARALLLATASDVLAVAAGVGVALGVAAGVDGSAAWLLAPLASGFTYVLVQAAELAVGLRRAQR